MRGIALLLFLLIGQWLGGQNRIDSLSRQVQNLPPYSVEKLQSLLALSKEWLEQQPDSAHNYLMQSLALSQKLKMDSLRVEALNQLANYHQRQSKISEAIELYDEALALALKIGYNRGLAKLYNNKALIYTEQGLFAKALEDFVRATEYEEKIGNATGRAQGLNNIGVVFYYQGAIDKALSYFEQSVAIHETAANWASAKQGYNNIGAIYESLQNYPKARQFYQKSLHIAQELKVSNEIANGYNNLGGIYLAEQNYPRSEELYRKALDINRASHDEHSVALNLLNLAELFAIQGLWTKAQQNWQLSDSIARSKGFRNVLLQVYQRRAEGYFNSGLLDKAYRERKRYDALRDSLFNLEKTSAIAEAETRYQTALKDQALAENEAALAFEQLRLRKRSFWLWMLIAAFLLLASVSAILIRQERHKRVQVRREALLKEQLAQAELREKMEAERNRIARDLHDHIGAQLTILSNQLDNFGFNEKDAAHKERLEKLSEYTRNTTAQLRETIWAMHNEDISLSMLCAKLRDFAQRCMSDEQNFVLDNRVSHLKLSPSQTIHLFRIGQEAILNAVKYAGFKLLTLSAQYRSGALQLHFVDDGCGIPEAAVQNGMGINNMKERIEELGGSFSIKTAPAKGTSLELHLPMNTQSLV